VYVTAGKRREKLVGVERAALALDRRRAIRVRLDHDHVAGRARAVAVGKRVLVAVARLARQKERNRTSVSSDENVCCPPALDVGVYVLTSV
jgi:hypothetical protein